MSMHRLHRVQKLPIPLEEAWKFFSTPANLSKITPPSMGFIIHSGAESEMYAGQIIKYTVKPLAGIPMSWVTEITHVREPHYFVDNQVSGPYRVWHHQHFFEPVEGGTKMTDIVHYQLPLGMLGDIVNRLVVQKKVESIFNHRFQVLHKQFGAL